MVKVAASMPRTFRSRAGVVCVAAAALLSCSLGEAHAQSDSLVPGWVKNVFGLYVDGDLPEDQFLTAITYLIDNGIMRVSASGIADEGDFDVEYGPSASYADAAEYLRDTRLLEDNAEWLNENYKLPYHVLIEGAECGEENAFYTPSEKKITMCYEIVQGMVERGYLKYGDAPRADEFAYNALDGVMLHELGHAFVDIYRLPITGLEEDAVDQFSALIQSRTYGDYDPYYETGVNMMIDVADEWRQEWDEEEGPPAYHDKHSLSIERFYNIACYAYGADPEYNSDLVGGDYLHPDRAKNCQYEYSQMLSSWDRLLEGYMIE